MGPVELLDLLLVGRPWNDDAAAEEDEAIVYQ
jgi:hypothetical protein